MTYELILGSSSPRRADLLQQIGVDFTVVQPNIDESVMTGELAKSYVQRMAKNKYLSIQEGLLKGKPIADQNDIVLCADTIIVFETEIMGKPRDREESLSMLERLSGCDHKVITSVTVGQNNHFVSFLVETIVTFRILEKEECLAYWYTGEPQDKAGGYGIQGIGSVFIQSISGSYSNVVGLPLMETTQALEKLGISVLGVSNQRF
ncbi:MAG: septum formation inhibitor Maf [Pseudomonadales bacterium]|nr:septum formation inhibitor Maf [Pseudomonadales bacterium]